MYTLHRHAMLWQIETEVRMTRSTTMRQCPFVKVVKCTAPRPAPRERHWWRRKHSLPFNILVDLMKSTKFECAPLKHVTMVTLKRPCLFILPPTRTKLPPPLQDSTAIMHRFHFRPPTGSGVSKAPGSQHWWKRPTSNLVPK
jgi:hypothetical protein